MKHEKIFEAFKRKADFIMKFQLVRAYYKSNDRITQLVEKILKEKYNQEWQEKLIKKVCDNAQGKRNALIDIPQFNFSENVEAIFDKFIENKFDKMVGEVTRNGLGMYPVQFRDIIEHNS
jgi:hypothetical protein